MIIQLHDFKEGEIMEVHKTYNPRELDLDVVDLHYIKPLSMQGTVEKGPDVLTFRGHLSSQTQQICGRCLAKITSGIDKDFEFYYEIKGKETLDITDDLRETLILDHPLSFVCSETCRGLCPQCGVNLNESTCQCRNKDAGGLTQLKDIWNKKKKPESS